MASLCSGTSPPWVMSQSLEKCTSSSSGKGGAAAPVLVI